MTPVDFPGQGIRLYRGFHAAPLTGLDGWYAVRSIGVHFRPYIDGCRDLRADVWRREGGISRAELWLRDPDSEEAWLWEEPADQLVWSRDYPLGTPGWHRYRDAMSAVTSLVAGEVAA